MKSTITAAALIMAAALSCDQAKEESSPPEPVAAGEQFARPVAGLMRNSYMCRRVKGAPVIDGRINDEEWEEAEWTEDFGDITGSGSVPPLRTQVKMAWDDDYFYVAARMEEPHIWATLTERDAVIWHDNDFEVFIDPDGDTHEYYELEINALGTVFDLFLVKPYRDGGPALHHWDIAGLKKGVFLEGTLNDPSDRDTAWARKTVARWRESVMRLR